MQHRLRSGAIALACMLGVMLTIAACGVAVPPVSSPTAFAARPATPTPTVATRGEAPPEPGIPDRRAYPTPTPKLPDLTPPPDGWIAYLTPERHLALAAPDGSRHVTLSALGPVSAAIWSPGGHWLAYAHRAGLTLISMETRPRLVPVADALWRDPVWSGDGRFLAYIYPRPPSGTRPRRYEIHLFDVSAARTIMATTQGLGHSEWSSLCGILNPPLVPVFDRFEGTLCIWDVQAGSIVATFPSEDTRWGELDSACPAIWLPAGDGLIFPLAELGQKEIELPGNPPEVGGPGYTSLRLASLAIWKVGEQAPHVLLNARERQRYWPEGWLPDGRLEVSVMEWSRDRYELGVPRGPEHIDYRYFRLSENGWPQETDAQGIPWWAGGGLRVTLGLPQAPQGTLGRWQVGPDGETVVFEQKADGCLYTYRGEGEPVLLAAGYDPRWQPVPSQP